MNPLALVPLLTYTIVAVLWPAQIDVHRCGGVGLYVTGYLYVCIRGIVLVRSVLELPALQMRREDDRTAGAIEIARGRTIGALERGIALTLVLLGQYGALGL